MQDAQRREYLVIMISSSLMNRILTISAIAMFAVVMGLAAFAPAALAKGPQPQDNVTLCHFDGDPDDDPTTDDSVWEVITPNIHAKDKHITNHIDSDADNNGIADDPQADFEIVVQADTDQCATLIATN